MTTPDPTPSDAEVLAAMTPQERANFAASMAMRERVKPDEKGQVPVKTAKGQG
jgi:hypothetical protein